MRSNERLGAFQVRDPKIAGLKLEKVYVLRAVIGPESPFHIRQANAAAG